MAHEYLGVGDEEWLAGTTDRLAAEFVMSVEAYLWRVRNFEQWCEEERHGDPED